MLQLYTNKIYAAQDRIGFLGCKHTLLVHVQLFIHRHIQPSLLVLPQSLSPQPVLLPGVSPNNVLDLEFGLVEPCHGLPWTHFLFRSPWMVPYFSCMSCTAQLGVNYKFVNLLYLYSKLGPINFLFYG